MWIQWMGTQALCFNLTLKSIAFCHVQEFNMDKSFVPEQYIEKGLVNM